MVVKKRHREVVVKVEKAIKVDKGIAGLVTTLNSIAGISTGSSCQGNGAKTSDPLSITDPSGKREDSYVTFYADGLAEGHTPYEVAFELRSILHMRVPPRDWGLTIELGPAALHPVPSVILTLNPRLIDFVTEHLRLRLEKSD